VSAPDPPKADGVRRLPAQRAQTPEASDIPPSEEDTPPPSHDPDTPPPEENVVVLAAGEFRLPDVLRHVEAGRIVRIIPAPPPAT